MFANREGVNVGIIRVFPVMKGKEEMFEYGYNLKIFPDDPIEVVNAPALIESAGWLGVAARWWGNVLSPMDTSKVPKPPAPEPPAE